MNDKLEYLILLSISLLLGYLIACGAAMFGRAGDRLAFIKEKGFEIAMTVLVAVPSAAFSALFGAFVIIIGVSFFTHHQFTKDERFTVFNCVYILCFIGMVIYGARSVTKD